MEDKDQIDFHGQYHDCRCSGVTKSQGTNSHDIDLVILEYSGFNARGVDPLFMSEICCSLGYYKPRVCARDYSWNARRNLFGCVFIIEIFLFGEYIICWSLHCRHNEHDGVSNHQPHHRFLNRVFEAQVKENIKAPRHWPLWGEVTGDRTSHYLSQCWPRFMSLYSFTRPQRVMSV